MKKLISLVLSIAIAASLIAVPVSADEEIKIFVDGNQVYTDVPPVMINDRTLAPVRAIGESLGFEVEWHEEWQNVFLNNSYLTIRLEIDDDNIYKNYNKIPIDVPAQLINDRIFVPVRAIAEAFHCNISYDENTNSVIINSDDSNVKMIEIGDGAYYIGEVADGFRDGYGKTYDSLGNWLEIGLYKRGMLNGDGERWNTNDGSKYYGSFVGGVPNGIGRYYSDGNENAYIAGNFVNALIEGEVTEYDNDGNIVFKGNYIHGLRNGQGTEYGVYGNIIYSGDYINGKPVNQFISDPITYIPHSIQANVSNNIEYYKEMPDFPDFGALIGVSPIHVKNLSDVRSDSYSYSYPINNIPFYGTDVFDDYLKYYLSMYYKEGFISEFDSHINLNMSSELKNVSISVVRMEDIAIEGNKDCINIRLSKSYKNERINKN